MNDTFHWLDVERIAEELADAHPNVSPYSVRFPELRRMVEDLAGFQEQPGHPVNERILEAVQQLWHQELDEVPLDDDDED
ncbi:MAG: Fe-S assembly protein IscX [Phycisphaeraceae bacterium]|nr:MAG: Fe-S assembly protein IscX [Phycisphaeraceae bacterium]